MTKNMNIMTSHNWIREYMKTDASVADFVAKTTAIGNSVERIYDLKERFDHMVVGQVVNIKKHPNADRLSVVDTKIGAKTVEIVCGGTNVREGMRVAIALPGAKVYWHGEGELTELKATEVRGVKSHGMICAAAELGFTKLPSGEKEIWDLTDMTNAKPGT